MTAILPISIHVPNSQRIRPLAQALAVPLQVIGALFLRILAALTGCVGAQEWGRKLQFAAVKWENRAGSLILGLWRFGRRFLVYSDNHGRSMPADWEAYAEKGYCRGACYWLIEKALQNPGAPLIEWAREFEKGVPEEAAQLHDSQALPPHLTEERVWTYRLTEGWDGVPLALPRGVYSFRLSSWTDGNAPLKSHRFALFNAEEPLLFDPSSGLAEFQRGDWAPHLERTAAPLDSPAMGYFTIECFRHRL